MKKIILLIPFLLTMYTADAQREREFQIRGGLGWSVYGTLSETIIKTGFGNFSNTTTDNAATLHLPLELRYAFNKRVNAGLDFKFGSYLYEPDSSRGKSNQFVVAGVAFEYSLIARERIRWYGGVGINGCNLVLEETDDLTDVKSTLTYSGAGFRFNTGILVFLFKGFGLNFNLGYDAHNFKLQQFKSDGVEQSLKNFEQTLRVAGLDGSLGAVIRF